MKASLKFRDDQTPLFKAKVPLNVLNFPFRSGVVVGHSKELSLQLGTFFESGPSLKLAYNPNDASNPFNLVVKTGTGKYGSPIMSSMVMSAEFSLVGNGGNPSFMVYFKPRFGDFGISKKQSSSVFVDVKDGNDSIEVIEKPKLSQGYLSELPGIEKIKSLPSFSYAAERLVKDVEINAATSLPVLNFANVKFQWGLRYPTEIKNLLSKNEGLVMNRPLAMSFKNIPFLMMNKISVEHVRGGNSENVIHRESAVSMMTPETAGKDDVSKMCLGVRHQLDAMRDENGMLRKALEDLRSEFSSVSSSISRSDEAEGCKQRSFEKDNGVTR